MSDELNASIESLAEKIRAIEFTPAEERVLAAALGSTAEDVEGFAYDLNPNERGGDKAYDLNPNDLSYDLNPNVLSFKLATSLGFKPTRPTSDADIGPVF